MMEMKKLDLKEKVHEATEKAKIKVGHVYFWCMDNKEVVAVVGPVLLTSGVELVKVVTRRGTVSEQRRLKENYIYDRKSGHYYELRRKLKNREWLEFDERKNRGESVAQILQDMRVLK